MGAGILPPRRMKRELSVVLTGMTGARPKSPPNSTLSPTSFPGTGMTRTAVVLLLIMPIAASSAMMALMVVRGRIAGNGDHVQPHAAHRRSSLRVCRGSDAPFSAACIMPISSLTGMNAPDKPAHVRTCHDAALFHRVVEQGERRRRAVSSHAFQPQFLQESCATLNRPWRA